MTHIFPCFGQITAYIPLCRTKYSELPTHFAQITKRSAIVTSLILCLFLEVRNASHIPSSLKVMCNICYSAQQHATRFVQITKKSAIVTSLILRLFSKNSLHLTEQMYILLLSTSAHDKSIEYFRKSSEKMSKNSRKM